MNSFHEWLAQVLLTGESVQEAPPKVNASERAAVLEVIRERFERAALDVAGPPIEFDAGAGYGAAVVLARACWHLVGPGGDPVAEYLTSEPRTPASHLSADVCLRLLPAVHHRAKARESTAPLAVELDGLLRRWPLSGVLADLDGEPSTATDFGAHPGLQLLYAERLFAKGRPGWVPRTGPTREWVDRIYRERGRPVPERPQERTGD